MNINVIKTVQIAGTVLGIASTILTTWAGGKQLKQNVAEEVAKQIHK